MEKLFDLDLTIEQINTQLIMPAETTDSCGEVCNDDSY
ncbi:hypothetical protein EV586_104404 [Tumebacillus sp. BK434]|nr:hypothetical protein EV586_104404 [Tumebacillus sp. BK434]